MKCTLKLVSIYFIDLVIFFIFNNIIEKKVGENFEKEFKDYIY